VPATSPASWLDALRAPLWQALGVMSIMDRHSIIEKIKESADSFESSHEQQIKQLISICQEASERELFWGLFSFFYDPELQENFFKRQKLAGTVLYTISPSCPINLDGFIYAIPQYWDFKIEEVLWYLCKIFGKTTVHDFLEIYCLM
jgi:hypothetical protein